MSIGRWIFRGVTLVLAIGGAALVAACGSGPAEQTGASNDPLVALHCLPGTSEQCTDTDPSVAKGAKTTCACQPVAAEQDTCAPDTRTVPSDSWLARAGCSAGVDVSPTAQPSADALSRVTVWTCTNASVLSTLPTRPTIFGDVVIPQGGHRGCTAGEIVRVMLPNDVHHPACLAPGQPGPSQCGFGSLASSCYPDPAPGQFVVVEWHTSLDADACGGNPGGCSGTSCACTAMCGLTT